MYPLLKSFHSYLAYIVIFLLITAIIAALRSKLSKNAYSNGDFKVAKLSLIGVHIMFVLGLVLYFISPYGFANLSGATMKDSFGRLLALEHPFTNILAILLITIGYGKVKRNLGHPGVAKTIIIFYGVGLLLLLSRIPWKVWLTS